ncbi:MAG: glycosyltransferase [Myxococcales bacterium]|nr:glycosyltransferase [Myxococcales bacterium]
MRATTIVIPCYNEADRLDLQEFRALVTEPGISLLFVDDGSSDATLKVLEGFASETNGVSVLPLSPNRGKAEAVRLGMIQAMEGEPDVVGFIDADMATPLEEVIRLSECSHAETADAVIGSRIAYMGNEIERHMARHLLGRVFATAASIALDAKVYDTQCGAKFFRRSDLFARTISEPFHSRWAFDVELLGRMLAEDAVIIEVPLRRWIDVPGSKIGVKSMVKAGLDLVQIRSHLAKRRR